MEMGGEISAPGTLDVGGGWSVQLCDQRQDRERAASNHHVTVGLVTMCECLRREADFLEEDGEEVGYDRPREPTSGYSGVGGLQAQGTGLL